MNPTLKSKFKQVLDLSNALKKVKVEILEEGDDYFEIEFEKEQHLFTLGRCFEPYKMPEITGSFTKNFDNSYLNKI